MGASYDIHCNTVVGLLLYLLVKCQQLNTRHSGESCMDLSIILKSMSVLFNPIKTYAFFFACGLAITGGFLDPTSNKFQVVTS